MGMVLIKWVWYFICLQIAYPLERCFLLQYSVMDMLQGGQQWRPKAGEQNKEIGPSERTSLAAGLHFQGVYVVVTNSALLYQQHRY